MILNNNRIGPSPPHYFVVAIATVRLEIQQINEQKEDKTECMQNFASYQNEIRTGIM